MSGKKSSYSLATDTMKKMFECQERRSDMSVDDLKQLQSEAEQLSKEMTKEQQRRFHVPAEPTSQEDE